MMKAQSGEGISVASVIFELMAISANVAYSFAQAFPFRYYKNYSNPLYEGLDAVFNLGKF